MITAKEAREISDPSAEDYLSFIEGEIRKPAEKKGRSVLIRSAPYSTWLYNPQNMSPAEKNAVAELESGGFRLSLYYYEYSIAADMGLKIEW